MAELSGHVTQEISCGCLKPVEKDSGAELVGPVVENGSK